ncbi:glycoside hydrolase family 3 N-terminal domain-containing protein [uncultured Kordia sp.]|uniref:glycoside hydrolase family 3 N-terminal domain-containing protein n=1 Tax=uncultured Kordia sp. TaxID=507699 RepID=UPI00260F20F6|nr:glycoside hydrolase family 3 N-terminal domain-containing protein [uncultured Kordia sp.]
MKKIYTLICVLAFTLVACEKEQKPTNELETKVSDLLSKMTLDEKIGQLNLRGTSSRVKGKLPDSLKQAVRDGKIGAFLNVTNTEYVDELQRIAVEESPNKIPLIFARDVIHGYKTIFPIPLGMAASWDTQVAKNSSRVAAVEASSFGIRWTFAPMLDIARDSRWGRIAESPGEDPFLASTLTKAYVEGFQGDSLNDPTSMIACAKHFIGYGAAIGGRDYNTAIISDAQLHNIYLPPFKSAVQAGSQTFMTSFNEMNGIPASGDRRMLTEVLREDFGFDGFVVSDWDSVKEMIPHGYAEDLKHAAELSLNAGLNMEMTSKAFEKHTKELLKEGRITEDQINSLVADILRVKLRMGLFEKPYRVDKSDNLYADAHLQMAKEAAIKSSVLLKNDNNVLPLTAGKKIAVIGPLADKPREQLGTWTFDGDGKYTKTPINAFQNNNVNYNFVEGLSYSRDKSTKDFSKAIAAAKQSDVIVFIGGEEAILSGEAHSRANINLPGAQEELIKELAKTGKPIVLVIMAGRPITVTNILDDVDAILMTWHPGTMGGPAIHDMIFGIAEPSGRLPVTWPKVAGQLPLFYNHKNTGRPVIPEEFVQMDSIPIGAWQSSLGNTSHYLDIGYLPQYPFGYGLSYTTFAYSNQTLSSNTISENNDITVKVTVKNTGAREGNEIVQLYVQDVVGRITRPVRELKGYQKVTIKPNEEKELTFTLSLEDLKYYDNNEEYGVEKGDFKVWIGQNAAAGLTTKFRYE